jgi:hypothetical protein
MSLHVEISQGLRVEDLPALQNKVRLRGGRLIAYAEVISALLISARSYKVKWIATPEERKSAGILSTVVSAVLGWWAIAGPYWTITAFVWNGRGGFDVTEALLRAHPGNTSLLGYSEASALSAFQDSASRVAFWICAALAILVVGAIGYLVWSVSSK